MIGAKMPGGFGMSAVKGYLSSRGFGVARQDGILVNLAGFRQSTLTWDLTSSPSFLLSFLFKLHSLSMEPQNRLGSEADAKAFLDAVIADYW